MRHGNACTRGGENRRRRLQRGATRMRRASWMSLGMIVTLADRACLCPRRGPRGAGLGGLLERRGRRRLEAQVRLEVLRDPMTRRWKGSLRTRSSVDFWYLRISAAETVPGGSGAVSITGRRALARGLGRELLARRLAARRLARGLPARAICAGWRLGAACLELPLWCVLGPARGVGWGALRWSPRAARGGAARAGRRPAPLSLQAFLPNRFLYGCGAPCRSAALKPLQYRARWGITFDAF